MIPPSDDLKSQVVHSPWYRALTKYEKPDLRKAAGQLFNTFLPYCALWIWMVWMVHIHASWLILSPLILLAAGLLVRIFIVLHDCGHGSFFASHRANRILGFISGILTFTPYEHWQHLHARHHAAAGDLDRRGVGDIKTMTVEEYMAAPLRKRLAYRFFRNPFTLLVIGPAVQFLIIHRCPHKAAGPRERLSVLITNLVIAALISLAGLTIGLRTYLLIQTPIILLAGTLGVWMFYVQHQYEGVYWAHHSDWDPIRAALEGSSYYRLPRVLQWFTGSIGLHHIHHLRPRIPNYRLQQCLDEVPELQIARPLTLLSSLHCLHLNLWDEKKQQLVSFRSLDALRKQE